MYARLARGKASTAATTRQADRSPIANKQRITAPQAKPPAQSRAKPKTVARDFSHLLPAHDVEHHETERPAPPAPTEPTQAKIGAAFMAAAAARARTPTSSPSLPAGSAAARIVAAGKRRRGEVF